MKHTIKRFPSTKHGVFGFATIGGEQFYSIERPWLNNEPSISCVPRGTYTLEQHDSRAHPDTYALVNEDLGVYHYPAPGSKRTVILIHVANTIRDIEGCIGLGMDLGCVAGRWAVIDSNRATKRAYQVCAPVTR